MPLVRSEKAEKIHSHETVERLELQDWPDDVQGETVQFRLIYQGPLPAETNRPRTAYKHLIRQQIHKQLKELYQCNQYLREAYTNRPGVLNYIANKYQLGQYRFIPLMSKEEGVACSLDILFLRRDGPGRILRGGGGDVDNRLKVLFDGLRKPENVSEIPDASRVPQGGEDPFYCLLEDDAIVTEVNVVTDLLLTPKQSDEKEHDVHLVIRVSGKLINFGERYSEYLWLT